MSAPERGGVPDGRIPDAKPGERERPVPELGGGPDDAPVLHLSAGILRELARAVEAAYPQEGCGVLLGAIEDGVRRVMRQEAVENRWSDRDDRYLLDPGTLRRLLEEEERGGPRILGFYHSHPDAAAEPSDTDREHAWPWYHYLIVPVDRGRAGEPRVWELEKANSRFAERALRVGGEHARSTMRDAHDA